MGTGTSLCRGSRAGRPACPCASRRGASEGGTARSPFSVSQCTRLPRLPWEKRPRQGLPSAGGETRRRVGSHSHCAVRRPPGRPCWCRLLGTRRQFLPRSDTFSAGGGAWAGSCVFRGSPQTAQGRRLCARLDPTSRGRAGGGRGLPTAHGRGCPQGAPARLRSGGLQDWGRMTGKPVSLRAEVYV